jgi:hypothetical protein
LATSVPQLQFTPQGPIAPSETDILAGVQIDIDYAFGGGVNPDLRTPQGQLASSEAAIIADKNAAFVLLCNQIDPQYSSGRFQDAIGRFYFMTRNGAEPTAVQCIVGGLPFTVIPAGKLASDTAGNTYVLAGDVTIGAGSTALSNWQNLVAGPIPCPTGSLVKVAQSVPGWDTITNPADGVLGRVVETAQEFEIRRQNSVAANARGSVQAIQSDVFKVLNVLDCYVIDNTRGFVVNKGSTNYPMLAHSLYVAVVGGVDQDIAEAIWLSKDTGCDYNGNTTVTVLDTSPSYSPPYPAYQVIFNRPTSTPVKFAVSLVNSPTLPSNIVALVQAAIVAQFTGTTGLAPARIGAAITGSAYYGAVLGVAPGITVLSVLVGISTPTLPQVIMGIDQAPVINASDITVTLV